MKLITNIEFAKFMIFKLQRNTKINTNIKKVRDTWNVLKKYLKNKFNPFQVQRKNKIRIFSNINNFFYTTYHHIYIHVFTKIYQFINSKTLFIFFPQFNVWTVWCMLPVFLSVTLKNILQLTFII